MDSLPPLLHRCSSAFAKPKIEMSFRYEDNLSGAVSWSSPLRQNGVSCLTVIIRKDPQQVMTWTDTSTNQSGLASILGFVARLLQSQEESGGLFVGDLIIHLIRRAGEAVLPVLPELLQAMLLRMKTAKTATFIQVFSLNYDPSVNELTLVLVEFGCPVQFLDSQSARHDTRASRVLQPGGRHRFERVRSDFVRKRGNIPRVLAFPCLNFGSDFPVRI